MGIINKVVDNMQACIDACNRCAQACYECFEACINEPDLNARRKCIKTLIGCSKMCQMSSCMMAINSQFAKQHCAMCADVCDVCTTECDMFSDEHCKICADICRICADECRKMASM
ncbi:MAG: four-helix bundle copper-binding protein [Bacillota bacterium]